VSELSDVGGLLNSFLPIFYFFIFLFSFDVVACFMTSKFEYTSLLRGFCPITDRLRNMHL
jgi:hypothetical protein